MGQRASRTVATLRPLIIVVVGLFALRPYMEAVPRSSGDRNESRGGTVAGYSRHLGRSQPAISEPVTDPPPQPQATAKSNQAPP